MQGMKKKIYLLICFWPLNVFFIAKVSVAVKRKSEA